jgi:hypothetical protein
MIREPTVAVVIPTYNHARYLETALASVYAQTVAPAEIIVIDDGSTDDPAAVVANHPAVRLIRQENQGLAAARNAGWRACGSDYLVFLDADDRLRPEALAVNLAQFQANPECGFVYGTYSNVYADTGRQSLHALREPGADPVAGFLRENLVGMHAAAMFPRRVLEAIGGYDPSLRACEDYDLYLRIAFRYPLACHSEDLAEYMRHSENLSLNAGMMLRTVLHVLWMHRAEAAARPEWLRALREGESAWSEFYARQWVAAWRRAETAAQRRKLLSQAAIVIRFAPMTLARGLARALRRGRQAPQTVGRLAAAQGHERDA